MAAPFDAVRAVWARCGWLAGGGGGGGVIGVSLWGHMMHRGVFLDAQPPGLRLFLRDGCCAIIVSVGRGMGSPCVRACALRFRGALIGGRARSGFLSGAAAASVGCSACVRALFARVFLALIGSAYVRALGVFLPLCFFVCAMLCLLRPSFFILLRRRSAFCFWCLFLLWVFVIRTALFFLFASLFLFIFIFLFSSWCHSTFSDVCAEADDMLVLLFVE